MRQPTLSNNKQGKEADDSSFVFISTTFWHQSHSWSVTASINAQTVDGTPIGFFLEASSPSPHRPPIHTPTNHLSQCTTEDSGRAQLEGEYTAMSALDKVVPAMIPRPVTWGKFQLESPPTYFFLAEFKKYERQTPRSCSARRFDRRAPPQERLAKWQIWL